MTITHELKSHPFPFEAVVRGAKTCEVRKDDRAYAIGDRIRLFEWFPEDSPLRTIQPHRNGYTGVWIDVVVTHLEREEWGLPPGLVVMSIQKLAGGVNVWPKEEQHHG
jgi:ParB family transcriptional regulator, chromosome partitioning protein